MKKLLLIIAFSLNLIAYEFVLLNSSSVEDEFIMDTINNQMDMYYKDETNKIDFQELNSKDEIIKLLQKYDYTDDKQVQQELIENNEELEEDLTLIFNTKYFLIVSETVDREGRSELKIALKVDNINYLDTQFIMPRLEDKDIHYVNTIANVVLTYIGYKDKNFIKVHQL